ncbi:hypothetical protein GCM10010191_46140 [Actinomadura vinacea]|uniref:Thiolase N-terminal domain-containing protein n=1 Tax=Actinomadura vinacea TaxID=115336 RepID=A0ABN3JGX5_9ACTN
MSEAVIAATARTPIGRADKGSLRDERPDDMAAQVVQAVLDSLPQLEGVPVDDLLLGCGSPGGEQGFNMARVVSVLIGRDDIPGVTLTRYCASSLQTTRMAMHAIRAGEGEVFVSAGVESVSAYARGESDSWPGTMNPAFDEARERSASQVAGSTGWNDPRQWKRMPDVYLEMGQTAENVALHYGVTRADMDAYALASQQRARAAAEAGFWQADITPYVRADGTTVATDDSPRPGTTAEGLAALAPCSARTAASPRATPVRSTTEPPRSSS